MMKKANSIGIIIMFSFCSAGWAQKLEMSNVGWRADIRLGMKIELFKEVWQRFGYEDVLKLGEISSKNHLFSNLIDPRIIDIIGGKYPEVFKLKPINRSTLFSNNDIYLLRIDEISLADDYLFSKSIGITLSNIFLWFVDDPGFLFNDDPGIRLFRVDFSLKNSESVEKLFPIYQSTLQNDYPRFLFTHDVPLFIADTTDDLNNLEHSFDDILLVKSQVNDGCRYDKIPKSAYFHINQVDHLSDLLKTKSTDEIKTKICPQIQYLIQSELSISNQPEIHNLFIRMNRSLSQIKRNLSCADLPEKSSHMGYSDIITCLEFDLKKLKEERATLLNDIASQAKILSQHFFNRSPKNNVLNNLSENPRFNQTNFINPTTTENGSLLSNMSIAQVHSDLFDNRSKVLEIEETISFFSGLNELLQIADRESIRAQLCDYGIKQSIGPIADSIFFIELSGGKKYPVSQKLALAVESFLDMSKLCDQESYSPSQINEYIIFQVDSLASIIKLKLDKHLSKNIISMGCLDCAYLSKKKGDYLMVQDSHGATLQLLDVTRNYLTEEFNRIHSDSLTYPVVSYYQREIIEKLILTY